MCGAVVTGRTTLRGVGSVNNLITLPVKRFLEHEIRVPIRTCNVLQFILFQVYYYCSLLISIHYLENLLNQFNIVYFDKV